MKPFEFSTRWIDERLHQQAPTKGSREETKAFLLELFKEIRENRKHYYWLGVYLLRGDELVVGPYDGPVTDHVRIPVGRGVCGTAVAERKDQIVDDVSKLANYLACNLATKSEYVALIYDPIDPARIIGQLDIDSTRLAAFDSQEVSWLRHLATRIAPLVRTIA